MGTGKKKSMNSVGREEKEIPEGEREEFQAGNVRKDGAGRRNLG